MINVNIGTAQIALSSKFQSITTGDEVVVKKITPATADAGACVQILRLNPGSKKAEKVMSWENFLRKYVWRGFAKALATT